MSNPLSKLTDAFMFIRFLKWFELLQKMKTIEEYLNNTTKDKLIEKFHSLGYNIIIKLFFHNWKGKRKEMITCLQDDLYLI